MCGEEKIYLNESEVSQLTGIAKQTLRNWRSLRRGMKYCKCGKCVRYLRSDVIEFMERNKIEPTC